MEGLITHVMLRRARKRRRKDRRGLSVEPESTGDGSEIRIEDSFVLLRFRPEPWRNRDGLKDPD